MKSRWSFVPKIAICSLLVGGGVAQAQNPQLAPVLQQLLQKYQKCILEEYENNIGEGKGQTNPHAVGPYRDPATCLAGNTCSRADRQNMYNTLKAQADRGDPTNFEANLEKAILNDCFQCAKHGEFHTWQMHCTLDCNGNKSWIDGFNMDAKPGPCFEGCKAPVEIEKIVNDIRNFVGGALGLGSGGSNGPLPPPSYSVAANRQVLTPPTEPLRCERDARALLSPPHYYIAPPGMLDWTLTPADVIDPVKGFIPPLPWILPVTTPGVSPPVTLSMYNSPPGSVTGAPGSTLGANEGRLRPELRDVARRRDPIYSLCQAAQRFTRNAPPSANTPSDQEFGNAFADLSVTGKAAFARFVQLHPNEAILRSNCPGVSDAAISTALTRAYRVANALRVPHESQDRHESQERQDLKWIAVSGEDDQPYRPVNVPTNLGGFPEFQTAVNVPGFGVVNTRYMIAHAHPFTFQSPANPLVDGGPGRKVVADKLPALANDAEVILFIHGMDSRLEEADDLTAALHRIGGRNWTVISMDLPTSGYSDNIHHQRISPISMVTCHVTPLVDFIENFIVAFVDTLDVQLHGQLKPRIRAVVGGSLGGNMSMRLGRRPNTPWITNVVPWSPAAIWPSMIAQRNAIAAGCDTGWDALKDRAVNTSLTWAGLDQKFLPEHENEHPAFRRELFYGGFDWSPVYGIGGPPQAQCWYSNEWPCKLSSMLAARLDRQETYDGNFRAWHWRLGAEQLAFSQQQFAAGTDKPLYLFNTKRMLLLGGRQDTCGDLCKDTEEVAAKMVNTPGYARFLEHTGHSLDNEHPDWVASQIADFLRAGTTAGGGSVGGGGPLTLPGGGGGNTLGITVLGPGQCKSPTGKVYPCKTCKASMGPLKGQLIQCGETEQ
ncbi:MAG TPA: alpha/beta hydrolase [Candidatus Dormibacteraeota bacterium]|nr:alpha/beta hydrolase [Candidatus Dormibacteraeota bacterium]